MTVFDRSMRAPLTGALRLIGLQKIVPADDRRFPRAAHQDHILRVVFVQVFRVTDLPVAYCLADGLIDGLRIRHVHRGFKLILCNGRRGVLVLVLFLRAGRNRDGHPGKRKDDPDAEASCMFHCNSSHICSPPLKIARTQLPQPGISGGSVVPVHASWMVNSHLKRVFRTTSRPKVPFSSRKPTTENSRLIVYSI